MLNELRRLAAQEKGWHAAILMADPGSAFHWAALLRWPHSTASQITGFVVVDTRS
jgi:hypothetical protein